MPIKRKTIDELKRRYGEDRGEDIYFALEQKNKHRKKKEKRKLKERMY